MSHLFEGCSFSNSSLQYDPSLYTIKRNRVWDNNQEYATYYTRTLVPSVGDGEPTYIYTEHTVTQPTEITDAENITGGYIGNVPNTGITNPSIHGSKDRLIIPPDLFYGLASTIDSTGTYDSSEGVYKALSCKTPLNGIIPKNVLKSNRGVRCNYLWENQVIIPQLVSTWESGSTTYNVYVHYPSKYTTYPNLSYAFNAECIVLDTNTVAEHTTVNYSLVLLEDSISTNTSSLSKAFSNKARWGYFGNSITTNTHQFNFIGKLNGEQVVHGLDPSVFTLLNMDNLFDSSYIQAVNGNLFSANFDAKYLKMSNENGVVIRTYGISGQVENAIPPTLILPKASGNIRQLGTGNYRIKESQIVDSSSSKRYYTKSGWVIIES